MSLFPDHTVDTAPPAARRSIEATIGKLGYLPSAVARLATSPHLLDGFLRTSAAFEATSLDPLARETVIMTIATRNDCHVCIAMHSAKLAGLNADPGLVAELRAQRPLSDARLEAARAFTVAVLSTAGAVGEEAMDAFLAHGFTRQNALEVVLGIGVYTMSTLANRMVDAPVDPPLRAFA